MKLKIPFIALIIIFLNSSSVLSQEYKAAVFNQKGGNLPYRILLPEGYENKKNYPLVLFLHGSGERGDDNKLQLFHGSKIFLDSIFRKKILPLLFSLNVLKAHTGQMLKKILLLNFLISKNQKTTLL
ncbi:hypothetical protein OAQ15_03155 [Flavobacteriaceae bacterium]|nr:hypothetical protein [Flavobacteriaceae bacterium]